VPSDVVPFEQRPWMKSAEIADAMIAAIQSGQYKLLRCNFANGDMVGHTGVFSAAVAAVECLDTCVGRIVAALDKVGGEALITADHGNVEQMEDECTGQAHTAHTCEPVPFIYVGKRPLSLREGGVLADVAPTLLTLLGLPQPTEMTGKSIISLS
jgi:2,3-bisphosphoglycerate-independent phosphoglycerate mutase